MNFARASHACLGTLVLAGFLLFSKTATAQIKQPGAHPRYSVELDAHVLIQHSDLPIGDEGFGLGIRAAIPFVHNGPIPRINNNIGITFGADFGFFGDDTVCRRRGASFFVEECNALNIWFPVTAQWNFFFTKVVSAFAEPGLALQYESWSFEGTCATGGPCDLSESDVDPIEPVFWFGGRFLFGQTVGLTVRLGYPSMAIGATFLL